MSFLAAVSVESERLETVRRQGLPHRLRAPSGRTRSLLTVGLLGLAIMLLAWQALPLQPSSGLDASWNAGLSMADHNGVTFGSRAIFTYGPLGFLTYPFLWYAGLGATAFLYNVILRFLLGVALFLGARQTFGGVVSFVLAVVVASISNKAIEPVLFFLAMVWVLVSGVAPRQAMAVAIAAGGISGFELLNKISVGVTLTAMTIVFVLCLPYRRRVALGAAAAVLIAVLVVFWLITGQDMAALTDYVKNSLQVVSGYSAAMGLTVPGLGWEGAAAVVALALGVWGALHTTVGATSRQRVGVVLLWVVLWFFLFKEGFVRHDGGHAAIFFDSLAGAFLAFHWRPGYRLTGLACLACLVAIALAAEGQTFGTDVAPTRNVSNAVTQIRDVVSSGRRMAILAAGRAGIRASEPIDGNLLPLLYGHTVAVYPTEVALAWAYGFDWDPIPVLQSYSAYTTSLDRFDASYLESRTAPQRILLRNEPGIDGRILAFDQGLTIRTMLCRYSEALAKPPLAVLALGRNRCSTAVRLSTVRADWGQTVAVPAPPDNHALVFVRIDGVGIGGLERIRGLLFKPSQRSVVLNGGLTARLVPGTAADGLPLRASPGMDYGAPFNIAVNATTISVLKQGTGHSGGRPLTFSFYSEDFSAGARGA